MPTREELEFVLDCQIIMIEGDIPDNLGWIPADIKLFYGPSDFSGKVILCLIGEPDLTGVIYTIPSDELCDAVYSEVNAQTSSMNEGGGITWDAFTTPRTKTVLIDGEYVETPLLRAWHPAVQLPQAVIDGG